MAVLLVMSCSVGSWRGRPSIRDRRLRDGVHVCGRVHDCPVCLCLCFFVVSDCCRFVCLFDVCTLESSCYMKRRTWALSLFCFCYFILHHFGLCFFVCLFASTFFLPSSIYFLFLLLLLPSFSFCSASASISSSTLLLPCFLIVPPLLLQLTVSSPVACYSFHLPP